MKSLFFRIFLWFCGTACVMTCIVGAGFVLDSPGALATNWRGLAQDAISASGRTAIETYERGGAPQLTPYLQSLGRSLNTRVTLFDSNGNALSGTAFAAADTVIRELATDPEGEFDIFPLKGLAGVRLRGTLGRSYLFITGLPPRERGPWGRVLFFAMLATGCLLSYVVARHVSSPVAHLRAMTARFSEGDLAARITSANVLDRRDEIGGLARDFNRMAGRIETLMTSQQRLMADVSHELRSPITRLGLAVGLIRRGRGDANTSLSRMEREVERLNALIGQLLTLSRLECLDQPMSTELFDLAALVQQIAVDAEFEAASLDRSVRLSECAACSMRGARDLIRSALENIVRNAVHYTDPNTPVEIRLIRANGNRTATIVVEDQGPGVPDAELGHVFDPFYRVDSARERHTGGAGLGLAITKRVVTLHGGSVVAANRATGGLEMRVTLPVEAVF